MGMSDAGRHTSLPRHTYKRWLICVACVLAVGAIGWAARTWYQPHEVSAQAPEDGTGKAQATDAKPGQPADDGTVPAIVATVNKEHISYADLTHECRRMYGNEVIDNLVNKHLIVAHCQEQKIQVTEEDVQKEIQEIADRFRVPKDQWLKMLEQERGINAEQYARDIVWPTLALRKLAGNDLEVTDAEFQKTFESRYGSSVQARMIACDDEQTAIKVREMAIANPADFSKFAQEFSSDLNTASTGGLIQPIHRHVGDPTLEKAAFSLQPGEISQVVKVGPQWIVLKCERRIPPWNVSIDKVRDKLDEEIRERKLRSVGHALFGKLKEQTKVVNVINDPELRKQYPGVAALINSYPIQLEELTKECIERHGEEVLESMIGRKLLEQACQDRNVTITKDDLLAEIAETAAMFGEVDDDGRPDIRSWLAKVTEEQEVTVEFYQQRVIWPAVALKRLVGEKFSVTDEDLQKGFEANYGERVRCRAIVLDNLRTAQEVWEKARRTPTVENFSSLAEQYSSDPSSRQLGGQIPPIHRHSGRPILEEAAFNLEDGKFSSVLMVDRKYVILFCEGRTTPVQVTFDVVRDEIYDEIFDKKQRIAMANAYAELQDKARISNFLTGEVAGPVKKQTSVAQRKGATTKR